MSADAESLSPSSTVGTKARGNSLALAEADSLLELLAVVERLAAVR